MKTSSHLLISIQDIRVEWLTSVLKWVQYLNEKFLFCVVFPFVINFINPFRSPRLVIFFCLSVYLSNFLALLFQEYRPFWYTKKITGELCLKGFGNPSTEIIIAAIVSASIAIEIFHNKKFKTLVYTIVIVSTFTIACSLLYLGENYPHQALTSLFLSFILVTFSFTFDEKLNKLVNKGCHNYKKNRVSMVYWYLIGILLGLSVLIIDILILSFNPETPKLLAYATDHCDISYKPNGKKNIENSFCVFYIFGYVFGNLKASNFISVYWNSTNWWKSVIRYIISVGFSFGVFTLFGNF